MVEWGRTCGGNEDKRMDGGCMWVQGKLLLGHS